jgi:hypothetical protein
MASLSETEFRRNGVWMSSPEPGGTGGGIRSEASAAIAGMRLQALSRAGFCR